MFYHKVEDKWEAVILMEALRRAYIRTLTEVLEKCPYNRPRSLAITALEESLTRAIQSLAIEYGNLQVPTGLMLED